MLSWSAIKRGRLTYLLLALVGGPLLAEGGLRWLLFSSSALAGRLGERFRKAELYVASPFSDDYNELSWRLQPPEVRARPVLYSDAEIGWLRADVDASGRHAEEERVGARRPVLLFGSSFARCQQPQGRCFEDELEESALASRFALLNYAVQGHGIDQTLLLVRRVLPRFAERDPIVIVAFVVEADLERSTLRFFSRPKPRFVSNATGFELELPDELDPAGFVARHPPAVTSYGLRALLNGLGPFTLERRQAWEGEPERRAARDELTAFLLAELARAAVGHEHFALLFHMKRSLLVAPGVEERALLACLEASGLSWVETRPAAAAALAEGRATLDELYEPWDGHPTELGTRVFFEALARGIEGEREQCAH